MTFHYYPFTASILAAVLVAAAPGASAQSFDAVRLHSAAPGTDGGSVGAAAIAGYAYPGSDQHTTWLVPVLDYQWANGWFAGVTNGVGYNFSASPELQYGVRVTADIGRKESSTSALHGMGDVDPRAEGGAFFNYRLAQGIFLTSSLRYGSGSHAKGLVADLGAAYLTEIRPRWHLAAGAGLTLANAHHMQSFFGVDSSQATASGYAVHTVGGGARDVHANLALAYAIDDRTSVALALSASSLLGDAKTSPLARQRTTTTEGLAFTYAF
jgi:MipA family protein